MSRASLDALTDRLAEGETVVVRVDADFKTLQSEGRAVFIARWSPTHGRSKWGNPSELRLKAAQHPDWDEATVRQVVHDEYRQWLLTQPDLLADIEELRGRALGCYCAPKPCHGDVLVELLNGTIRP